MVAVGAVSDRRARLWLRGRPLHCGSLDLRSQGAGVPVQFELRAYDERAPGAARVQQGNASARIIR